MQKILLILFLCISSLIILPPGKTSAHLAGQPPFFLVNGKYSGFYPVYVTSLKNFLLPQDTAPETYLINEPLNFEIDQKLLPFPASVIDQMTYSWDFGDGQKTQGISTTHTYTKMGSYLLTIKADYAGYNDLNTKPLLQAILITILPEKEYRLPQAVITVNKKMITDPINSTLSITSKDVTFNADHSRQGSAPITTYIWDLGDGTSSEKKKVTHTFSNLNQIYIFPMLRVKDANGFISDAYVQLEKVSPTSSLSSQLPTNLIIPIIILSNLIIIGGIIFLVKKH